MRATRQRDTAAELALRRALHRRGLRYRINVAVVDGLRRRPDLVFSRARVVVFVDGCFWHACPVHATFPKANAQWWKQKLEANRLRDRDTDRRFVAAGWHVERVWEHEVPEEAAARVADVIAARIGRT